MRFVRCARQADEGCARFVEMEWAAATVLSALERKRAERATAAQPLLSDVRSRLSGAAQALRERFGARRVLLFGSYARGTPSVRSDVDVAVEGVAAKDHFPAMAFLSERLRCSVDLVLLEDLRPEDRQRLLEEAEPV